MLKGNFVKILIVDDEEMIRDIASMVLKKAGFDILLAENGESGVELYKQHHQEISLVLLDINMDGLSGYDTLRAMREINENILCVFSSGEIIERDNLPDDIKYNSFILQKPYRARELTDFVNDALKSKITAS